MSALRPRRGEPVPVVRFAPGASHAPAPIRWSRPTPVSPPSHAAAPRAASHTSAALLTEVVALGDLLAGMARSQAATAEAHARWMEEQAAADAMLAALASRLAPGAY